MFMTDALGIVRSVHLEMIQEYEYLVLCVLTENSVQLGAGL